MELVRSLGTYGTTVTRKVSSLILIFKKYTRYRTGTYLLVKDVSAVNVGGAQGKVKICSGYLSTKV